MVLAVEMIGAAAVLSVLAVVMGEQITAVPTTNAVLAIIYLAIFGSMMGFTAYMYLLQTVRPSLATSYAYINPLVAVILGFFFAGESFSLLAMIAMGVILTGVIIVMMARSRS
jgi:drug/metabolite transporter (DMT)-like permease